MRKIAIITLYDDINFGNKLQNYATQVFFKQRGFEVETVPYVEERHPHRSKKYWIHRWICWALVVLGIRKNEKKDYELDLLRRECIKSFSDEYIQLASEISYRNIPRGFEEQYDYFVTGSDQVWRSWNDDKNELIFFLLMFAPKEKKLTMSPSFGLNIIDKKYKSLYREGLRGFPKLSVREQEGKKIIKDISGIDATVLLDPTMLIDESVWREIQRKPGKFKDNDYILLYLLGGDTNHYIEIQEIANAIGGEIVNLFDYSLYTCTRPDEFLYWINNAKLVITDSFHATVFSILFKRDFIVYVDNNSGMSSRMTTLLDLFGLTQRGYKEGQKVRVDDLFRTDFSRVKQVLFEERTKANQFYENIY